MPQSPTVPGLFGSKRKSKLIYRIKNGLLYSITDSSDWQQVKFFPTDNFHRHADTPDRRFVIVQSTCSPLSAYGYAQWLQSENSKSSVHLCIDTDGTIVQQVEFNIDSKQFGADERYAGYSSIDSCSINIAVVNPGPLVRRADGGYGTWWGDRVSDSDIIESAHPNYPDGDILGWVPYTRAQVSVLMTVIGLLSENSKHLITVGIDSVSPYTNKTPGASLDQIFYNSVNHNNLVWKISESCDCMSGPGSASAVVARLNTGTILKPIRQQGSWTFVLTPGNQEVWVHNNNLTTRS